MYVYPFFVGSHWHQTKLIHTTLSFITKELFNLSSKSFYSDLFLQSITEHNHSSHAVTTSGLSEEHERLMKMLVCLAGIYGFYIFETIMVLISNKKTKNDVREVLQLSN